MTAAGIAARGVFVDTGAWVALRYARDSLHGKAVSLLRRLRSERRPLVTTDYVLAVDHALELGDAILSGQVGQLVEVDAELRGRAWELCRKYRNQKVGFVDCTSFAVMERLRLTTVFGFDGDFEAARFVLLE
jgi:hypothetical protein